ncbi:MAG: type I restriction-modification system subunit M [Chloroflexi bacterium]|nr:type I restriction-modification system subunit M [Chloroflexota bacterium]
MINQNHKTASPVDLSKLESHIWEAANILRGPVDAADFKTYIFPLLFFKRICDVYDEEIENALKDSAGDADFAGFPENHRFQIPHGCHWNDIRERQADIGKALMLSFNGIGTANPATLMGIFGDAAWTNKERLPDSLLRDLIDHFSRLRIRNVDVDSDVMGQAYEYLIKKFADATNKKAGEFYTPRSVVRLMVDILDPQPGETIYDPACGTGGMLLGAVQHVMEKHGSIKRLFGRLYGQEKNLTTSSIARMNLFLHGVDDFQILRGDTLRQPLFFDGDHLMTFDCVIANPPFSLEKWGEEIWRNDPYGRCFAGLPPSGSGDYAWVQHMLKSLRPRSGRMAVVLPHGTLFRGGAEGKIRQTILEMDLLEAVIGLAPNLFYGATLAAAILVFRKQKSPERRQKVLMIDGSKLFHKGRNQNTLDAEHAGQILQRVQAYQDVPGFARVVSLEEISQNDYNLNIPRYIEPSIEEADVIVEEVLQGLKSALNEANAAEDHLLSLLKNAGLIREV